MKSNPKNSIPPNAVLSHSPYRPVAGEFIIKLPMVSGKAHGSGRSIDNCRGWRVYASYGGVYIFVAILWLWFIDGIQPTKWDIIGSMIAMLGMAIIMFSPRN